MNTTIFAPAAHLLHAPRHDRLGWFLVVLVTLALIVPIWFWLLLPERSLLLQYRELPTLAPALALGITLYCALRLALIAYRGQPKLLATTFFVFIYVWGGIAAFAQCTSWTFPWVVRHDEWIAVLGLLQLVLTIFAYESGTLLAARRRALPASTLVFRLSHRRLFWLCVAAVPLTGMGLLILGPEVLFTTRAAYGFAVSSGGASKTESLLGSALLQLPPFVAFVLVCIVCKRDWRTMSQQRKQVFFLLLLGTGLLNVVANYPLSLPRQWLGTIVLAPVFALLPWRRWQVAGLGVGLIVLVLLVFPYADAFRRQASISMEALSTELQQDVIDNVLNKGDFDVFQQSLNTIVVVGERGHSYGKNFLGAALFWVPRRIWTGKPYGTGVTVAYGVGYRWSQTKLSSPLWMESYWAFGWAGILLIIGGYGYFSARLDRGYVAARANNAVNSLVLIMVPFLAAYQFILVRGDIIHGTARLLPAVVLFLLAADIARMRRSRTVG